jgi:aldehyde dehydrogenase
MSVDESEVRSIVQEVVDRVTDSDDGNSTSGSRTVESTVGSAGRPNNGSSTSRSSGTKQGSYTDVDAAVESARMAYNQFRGQGNLSTREQAIEAIREVAHDRAEQWGQAAVDETGFGRPGDKLKKIKLCAEETPGVEDIEAEVTTGEHGLTLEEFAPWGVIGSITPSTNPAATMVNNSISMIAAGNAVVFNPHPAASDICTEVIHQLNKAIQSVGGPPDLLTIISEPTLDTAQNVFHHDDIDLLSVTGGGAVVEEAMKADKRVLAAGPGNPPVVVDSTADIPHAAEKIIEGASFDNNVLCTCEKEILAVESIADDLLYQLCQNGGYELTDEQAEELCHVVLEDYPSDDPSVNKDWVGQDPQDIAAEIGLDIPDDVRMLIANTGPDHPFAVEEMLMPVIPLIRVPDVDTAIDLAVELEHGFQHTAMIHSQNVENMHRMAVAMNTSIFVKNGSNLNGLGHEGEGWTSMTITTPTGEGITSARTFVRRRRCVLVDYFRIV